MKYDKLVRDNIPAIIAAKGEQCTYHRATDSEYQSKLQEKLLEEAQEFVSSGSVDELADILEVFYAILEIKNLSFEKVEAIRLEKVKKRGSFSKRIILEES